MRFRQLASSCGLELPELSQKRRVKSAGPTFFEKLPGLTPPPPPIPWPAQPLAKVADWTVAASYEQLPRPTASEYEVARAIMGITSDKSGVPVEEMFKQLLTT